MNVGNVLGAFQIYAAEAECAIHKVDVAIHEAGHDELSGGINNFCAGAAKFFDRRVLTNCHDAVGADSYGLRPGLLCVEGVDAAVQHDGVRAIFRILRVFNRVFRRIFGMFRILRIQRLTGTEKQTANHEQDVSSAFHHQRWSPRIKMSAAY